MTTLLYLLVIASWALLTARLVKRSVHMLQQNSYRNERYVRWMKKNKVKVFPIKHYLVIIPFLLALVQFENSALILSTIVYTALAVFMSKEIEKKKLVVTARVKRLLITTTVLLLIVAVCSYFLFVALGTGVALALLFLVMILTYHFLILANMINNPIELRINQFYFDDAKKLLKSSKDLKTIGITGSYGKTSVKHFLAAILGTQYNVLMTPESYNTKLGVTRTIREKLKPYHEVFIAEMGAKQEGDIKEICDLVEHQYGILTAIGPQHLETFKTLDNIKKTKYEIIETLPEHGVGFLNGDDGNIRSVTAKNPCRKVYFGIHSNDLDFKASDISYDSRGMSFTLTEKNGESIYFSTKLLGEHNVYNILAGVSVARELGIPLQKMAPAIKALQPVKHRLELRKTRGNITIIDDSFNSNPKGAKMAIDVLAKMEEFKVLVTPGMIELGEEEYALNKEFAEYAAKTCDYIILVGKRQTKPLQDGLATSNYPKEKQYVAANLQDAIAHMNGIANQKTVVLLENDLPDSFNE
ncbi:UDP-N-acetylmuramoyl-tripeptide--D-alanyl-D-alanine ligase [Alkalihalobacillus deserti]|uniref:UDP-N-acetylmuramoyl-tripeptide--D-alanyl-D- alanine ligase n=1 Tax=Alkalihalobacillus deserti TaxID=2879466 RepID=UPI001D13BEB7|nr:UDP-N-acetylmuramoyl-tripeptide--D-alanyl-D-alanine ligase [Alkalihalobacillus deserti]